MSKPLALAACALSTVLAAPAAARTSSISPGQFAQRADRVCAADYKQQAALGPGLINADDVKPSHLSRATRYLDRIVAITQAEVAGLTAIAPTSVGMAQRHAVIATLQGALSAERSAVAAGAKGNLAGFRTGFDRLILHGFPKGPAYLAVIRAQKAAARIFPYKVCGRGTALYP
jgi:hypothetical protein